MAIRTPQIAIAVVVVLSGLFGISGTDFDSHEELLSEEEYWVKPDVLVARTIWNQEFKYSGTPGEPIDVGRNMTILAEKLFLPYPGDWGEAYIDNDLLIVNSVKYSKEEAENIIRKLGITQGIDVREFAKSKTDYQIEIDKIFDDPILASVVVVAGSDWSSGAIAVGLTPDKARTVSSKEVANRVEQVVSEDFEIQMYVTGRVEPDSRYYDTSPFHGGNAVTIKNLASCSSAFAWNPSSGSDKLMISAAHFNTPTYAATDVYRHTSSGDQMIGALHWYSATGTGTVSGKHGDIAIYKLSGTNTNSASIYTGTYDSTTTKVVKAIEVLPVGWHGTNLRTSGASGWVNNGTGEIDPDWISLANQTVRYSTGQKITDLSVAEHASKCISAGDSGGAFYTTVTSTTVNAVGALAADNGGGVWITNCKNYYTPIQYVSADFGGSLKVG